VCNGHLFTFSYAVWLDGTAAVVSEYSHICISLSGAGVHVLVLWKNSAFTDCYINLLHAYIWRHNNVFDPLRGQVSYKAAKAGSVYFVLYYHWGGLLVHVSLHCIRLVLQ